MSNWYERITGAMPTAPVRPGDSSLAGKTIAGFSLTTVAIIGVGALLVYKFVLKKK